MRDIVYVGLIIVETGISLMELDCLSLEVVISLSIVMLRELIYVVTEVLIAHYSNKKRTKKVWTRTKF